MSSFLSPKFRAIDENGTPLDGAKLYFYETGTTTPKDTYSNQALTNANANPVVSDSAGWFGRIYLDTDAEYTVKLTKSDGTLVWSVDNVDPAVLNGTLNTRVDQIATNPLDYGAAGNGSTNDYQAIQDAIDAATGTVDLLGKTYRCDSALAMRAGVELKNGAIDFSQAASQPNEMLVLRGSRGSAITLSGNATIGDTTITLTSVSGLAENDWLFLYSSASWSANATLGEMVQIDSISGTTVTLKTPIAHGYLTADSASVKEITTKQYTAFTDLTITANAGASTDGKVLVIDMAEGVEIRNVRINGAKGAGINVRASVNVRIRDCILDEDDGAGVGIDIGEHSRDIFVDACVVRRFYDGIKVGTPETAKGVTYYVTISNCRIEESSRHGIRGEDSANFLNLIDNEIVKTASTALSHIGANVCVRGGRVISSGSTGLSVSMSATYTSTSPFKQEVDGIRVISASSTGISIGSSSTVRAIVRGCIVYGSATGISVGSTSGAVVAGNLVEATTSTGIAVAGKVTVSGNSVLATTGQGILSTAAGATIVSNYISMSGAGANIGIYATNNVQGRVVAGNTVSMTYGKALDATGSSFSITGNSFVTAEDVVAVEVRIDKSVFSSNACERGGDSSECIDATDCDDTTFAGNAISNGSYGIIFTTCTGCLHDGNVFVGQATGTTSGGGVTAGDSA